MIDQKSREAKAPPAPPPIFMRMREVSALIGLKPHAIDRAIRAGLFPRPFLIGVRAKAFSRESIDQWIAERGAARDGYTDPAVPSPLSEQDRAARYEAARDGA